MAAEYRAVASLDNSRFLAGLNGMSSGLGSIVGRLAGLAAAFIGVRQVINGFSQALNQGSDLNDLSARTGIAVKDLFVLQQAFGQVGSSAESVAPAIQKMQQVLSGVSRTGRIGRKILEDLGLKPEELRKLGTQEQFSEIASAIGRITDPAQQAAAAIELFGEAGPQLREMFANPAVIKKTAEALGELPAQVEKSAARFDELADRMQLLRVRGQGIFVGAMEGLAPAISQLMGVFERIDFSRIGRFIGDAIGIVVELFASGDITEAARLALGIGFAKAVNTLASTIGSITFWKGITAVAIAAFMEFGATLIRIFSIPLTYLEAGIEALFQGMWAVLAQNPYIGQWMFPGGFTPQPWSEIVSDKQNNGLFSVSRAIGADETAKPILAQGMRLMREAMANPKNVLDSSEWQRQLTEILDKARTAAQARSEATSVPDLKFQSGPGLTLDLSEPKQGKPFQAISDEFAKIGLYLGGTGGSGLDYTRRTATATEKSATLLNTIAAKLQPATTPGAVWG